MHNSARRAGILLPVTALPACEADEAAEGGLLGARASAFVDFLADAGQSLWQVLPIGPVGVSLSPYQSSSAFAGNPAWISPARENLRGESDYEIFLKENEFWLEDFALFTVLKERLGGTPLQDWPAEYRCPAREALGKLRRREADAIEAIKRAQYCFFAEWRELKAHANLRGISIVGDLPFYPSEDSAEFWLRRDLFETDKEGRPSVVAGVPPDAFSADGQIWNNPVYAWERRGKEVLAFWLSRLTQAQRLYDVVRIDHFRAFADYYTIPIKTAGRRTKAKCKGGVWKPGPGRVFLDAVRKNLPGLRVIAEDLGDLSGAAQTLCEVSGYPGMKVLQFAFEGGSENAYLPHNIEENSVVYTGTHDNDTARGWANSLSETEAAPALRYFGLQRRRELPAALRRAALMCRAETAILPLQDWLGLGRSARINTPSTMGGRNWKWQTPAGVLTRERAETIREETERYGR